MWDSIGSALLLVCLTLQTAAAIRIPVEKRGIPRAATFSPSLWSRDGGNGTAGNVTMANLFDYSYVGNVTVGGTSYQLVLDTGSADLWVSGVYPLNATNTSATTSIQYGTGLAEGNINLAVVEFAGFEVASQAFLFVEDTSSFPGFSQFNTTGIAGIGPSTGIASAIEETIGIPQGSTLLDHIFELNTSTSNYLTFLLGRFNDTGSNITSEITISELVPGYENVTAQPQLPAFVISDPNSDIQHWATELDAIIGPDGQVIPFNSTADQNPGKSIAMLDSGTSLALVPTAVANAIYGRVQNATLDPSSGMWYMPCGQELNVTFVFGGLNYSIHPLDTSYYDGSSFTDGTPACTGAFIGNDPDPDPSNPDMILGDTVMRNLYTLMNYGDFVIDTSAQRAAPYMQLLSITDPAKAHLDFVNNRLGGVDTTGDPQYALLPPGGGGGGGGDGNPGGYLEEMSVSEKIKHFFTGKHIIEIVAAGVGGAVLLITACACLICCCIKRRRRSRSLTGGMPSDEYMASTSAKRGTSRKPFSLGGKAYRGLSDPSSAPEEGGAVLLHPEEEKERYTDPYSDA